MKTIKEEISYFPYTIDTVKKVDFSDLKSDSIYISADKIDKGALPFYIKPKKVHILNSNCVINDRNLKKGNYTFYLDDNVDTISFIFSDLKAKKIIFPKSLRHIAYPGFYKSSIDTLEIPNNIKLDRDIFKESKIKHLVVNRKLLSKIEVKWLLEKPLTLTIKDENRNIDIKALSKEELKSFSIISKTLDYYIDILENNLDSNNFVLYHYLIENYESILKKLEKKISEKISICDELNVLTQINKDIKKIYQCDLTTDGYSMIEKGKTVKILTLEDVLNKRNLL